VHCTTWVEQVHRGNLRRLLTDDVVDPAGAARRRHTHIQCVDRVCDSRRVL
jgi:hypothetical protein